MKKQNQHKNDLKGSEWNQGELFITVTVHPNGINLS